MTNTAVTRKMREAILAPGTCGYCGKRIFNSRQHAKRFVRKHNIKSLHAYQCADSNDWHIGHIPHDVRYGAVSSQQHRKLRPHQAGITHPLADNIVRNELSHPNTLTRVTGQIVANIALFQRLEDRNPLIHEIRVPDALQDITDHPDEDWTSSSVSWKLEIMRACLYFLYRTKYVRLVDGPDGVEARIGLINRLSNTGTPSQGEEDVA